MKAAIIGGAGYTGGELIRLLMVHPYADLVSVVSDSQQGKAIASIHKDLRGDCDLTFAAKADEGAELLFICKGHGESAKYLAANPEMLGKFIVDLSTDFRPRANPHNFVYGLPELNKSHIASAKHIANPGCFATAIQLGLMPLAQAGLLQSDIHIHAITGSSGAGQQARPTTHFSWRNNNVSIYKLFEHQHLAEITESLQQAQPGFSQEIHFVPLRGNFPRGILASVYTRSGLSHLEALEAYTQYYQTHPFVTVTEEDISLKEVVNTNKCLLQIRKKGKQLHITSIIDNLLKGASGQAVQNMNLLNGWDENAGLKLKAIAL